MVNNQTVINCLQLSDTKTRDDENEIIYEKVLFSGWIGPKTWQGENDGY